MPVASSVWQLQHFLQVLSLWTEDLVAMCCCVRTHHAHVQPFYQWNDSLANFAMHMAHGQADLTTGNNATGKCGSRLTEKHCDLTASDTDNAPCRTPHASAVCNYWKMLTDMSNNSAQPQCHKQELWSFTQRQTGLSFSAHKSKKNTTQSPICKAAAVRPAKMRQPTSA